MSRLIATLTALIIVLASSFTPVFGQAAMGALAGRVADALGGVLPGAVVTAVSPDRTARADVGPDGRFSMDLPAGDYDVRVDAEGFTAGVRRVTIRGGATLTHDFVLEVAPIAGGDVLVVVGRDYRVTRTETATKSETPILRVPQSIQVVTSQVIADQRPLILSDALRNVSGFSALRNSAEVFGSFNIRGFTTIDMSVDGLRNTYALNDQAEGIAHVERVEVIKGPSAALYGRGGLGGTVNLVTKTPERARGGSISVSTGSGSLFQPTIDVTGPLSSGGAVRGRVVVDYEDRDTPIDHVSVNRRQIAPSLAIDLGSMTTVTLRTDYRSREGVRFVALPFYGTVTGLDDLRLPYSLFIGEPGAGATTNSTWQSTARVDHRLSAAWSLAGAVRWTETAFDMPSVGPRVLGADNRTLTRRYTRFDETQEELAVDAWTRGTFQTGAVTHTVVVGADWSRFDYDSQFFAGGVAPLDIARPQYGAPITGTFLLDHTRDRIGGVGLYAQNQMALSSRLDALVGVRYDRVEKARTAVEAGRTTSRDDGAVSPRAGVSYRLTPGVAVFGAYSEGLVGVADGTANQTGTPFSPEGGRQWEGGLKLDLAGSLSMTTALFQLTRTGVLVPDPANPSFRVQSGEQRATGLEADLAWQSAGGASVIASYAFTNGEVTKDTAIPVGNRLVNLPRHAVRLWGKYALTAGANSRIALAAGITAQDEQQANTGNTLAVPGYWVADAGLFWERGRIGVQLNAVNLFDKEYPLRAAFGNTGIIPGETRRVVLTLKTAF